MRTTRPGLILGFAALSITAGILLAQPSKRVMGSAAYDWNSVAAVPTKNGFVRHFFDGPTATLDRLECHVTTLNPGEAPHPPHQHPAEEIFIIKEGTVEVLVNGEWKKMGPGSVIFEASNSLHGIRNAGGSTATYHVLSWEPVAKP
jgi:quercetin dioxygenase-like cupin family protein